MTPEEKQLLLIDLCARLPHRVKVKCERYPFPVTVLYAGDVNEVKFKETGGIEHIDVIKPYLRPMSSMTEEEENEWNELNIDPLLEAAVEQHTKIEDLMLRAKSQYEPLEWLNAHHFDYRGLIPMGLALEAPKDMYKTE